MTAPAIWADTSLDSIVFSDEERGENCEYRRCGAEALYVGIFLQLNDVCPHPPRRLYCLAHKDAILELHRRHLGDGDCFTCSRCPGSRSTLHRMEPIR